MLGIQKKTISMVILCLFVVGMTVSQSFAQEKLPVRPYTSPDQMISLSKDITFSHALDILNSFALKYKHKFILNRTSAKGPIGVSLPAMDWYDALKYLGEIKGFQIIPHKDYYELDPVTVSNGSGAAASAASSENGKGKVTTKTREVRIAATFFEGNRDALSELGIDWSTFKDGVVKIASNSASDVVNNKQFSINLSPFEIGNSGINVQALFQAFESKDLGQIISQPTIKVMNGQEGHIQVGQTFFVNQKDFAGNTISKSYNVGTILTVTPHVITQNDTTFIYLKLHVERSSLQPNTANPTVSRQLAESDILLISGESTVIAGLYETSIQHTRKGIPILKDLPPWFFGLRYLFGYNSKQYTQQELIIIIKATLSPDLEQQMHTEQKTVKELLEEQRRMMRENNKKVKQKTKF